MEEDVAIGDVNSLLKFDCTEKIKYLIKMNNNILTAIL